jgi:hypothetical protein
VSQREEALQRTEKEIIAEKAATRSRATGRHGRARSTHATR